MSIEIFVPDIGADEVEVTEVLVKAGDTVTLDQSLLSVEGDKAAMEVPAPQAGVVQEVRVKAGDKVKTGSLIMVFAGAADCSAGCCSCGSAVGRGSRCACRPSSRHFTRSESTGYRW